MASLPVARRRFLKAAGVSIALPLLESLPRSVRAADKLSPPHRMVCVGNEFGMFPGQFWPKESGSSYGITPLLEPLEAHRRDFTLFSHLDHGVKGGHFAVHTFLTGVKSSEAKGTPDAGMSLDQRAAEFVGSRTRFPSIAVGSEDGLHGGCMMSWTRTGTRIPPVAGPRELFALMFVDDGVAAKRQAEVRLQRRESILDALTGDARSLSRRVSHTDQEKLQEYFAAIRDVEAKLELDHQWQKVRKPKVDFAEPSNEGLTMDLPKIYDLIALALQTDTTRVATLEIGGSFAARDLGIREGYHSLSHHGHLENKIEQLVQIERYQIEHFARFLEKLKSLREPNSDGTLLDRTMALFGSGMGNANAHTNSDLPVVLAGGGFRHGEHKQYPQESRQRVPLCNLFLSMLQQFGVETDHFSTSTGTLTGLEQA